MCGHFEHNSASAMRNAVVLLSLIAAATAEAPYHLPRPAPHAPAFSYPQPAPPQQPPPPAILPHLNPFPQVPHPHLPVQSFSPQPAPQPNFIQSGYSYAQPAPIQLQPQIHPQHQVAVHALPHIAYYALQPQLLPVSFPRPQQIYQQHSVSYSQPQAQLPPVTISQPRVEPVRTLPALTVPQQPSPIALFQHHQQFSSGQGYSYQQPQIPIAPLVPQLPLQSQTLSSSPSFPSQSSLSSYQADNNQYNTPEQSQTHREALDSIVVSRVQNIIKENEHTSARDKGFLSLVSGVSLENAKPSVEISSFVHNSALPTNIEDSSSFTSSASSQSSSAIASTSSGSYGLPSITSSSQSNSGDASLSFLPHTQPATSYGTPN